jgi:hypothetical protein
MDRELKVPDANEPGVVLEKVLPVPYEYQLDNQSGTGYRECFSSTCAMICRYYGKVKSDDEYNKIRAEYGDSNRPKCSATSHSFSRTASQVCYQWKCSLA